MNIKSRTEFSILNIFTGIFGYLVNTIIGFICRIIFVKCLSTDYLGINGLFTNILMMLSLAELGIGSAIVYALYKPLAVEDKEKVASLVKVYKIAYKIIGVSVFIIGLCLIPFLNVIITEKPNIDESIYLIYFIYLFNTSITYFFSYKSSLIIASQQNYIVSGLNYIVTIIQSILQIIYLFFTKDYIGYLLIQTIGSLIYNVIISKTAEKMFPYISKKDIKPLGNDEKKSLVNDIKDLSIYKLSGLLVNSTDNIIITFFGGLGITGVASNYTLLINTLSSLLNQIFNGISASIGNYNALESNEKKYNMFKFLNLTNYWIFSWASIGIIFVSSDLVEFCFGSNYVLPIEIPLVLALNFYTVGMQNSIWTYKQTLGLFKYGKFIQILTALFNLIFSIILGYKFGLFGILLATFISRLLTNLWYDPYIVLKYGLNKNPINYLIRYIRYLMQLIITIIVCYILCNYIKYSPLINIIVKSIICSIVSNIIFVISSYKSLEWVYLHNTFKKIFSYIKLIIKKYYKIEEEII